MWLTKHVYGQRTCLVCANFQKKHLLQNTVNRLALRQKKPLTKVTFFATKEKLRLSLPGNIICPFTLFCHLTIYWARICLGGHTGNLTQNLHLNPPTLGMNVKKLTLMQNLSVVTREIYAYQRTWIMNIWIEWYMNICVICRLCIMCVRLGPDFEMCVWYFYGIVFKKFCIFNCQKSVKRKYSHDLNNIKEQNSSKIWLYNWIL